MKQHTTPATPAHWSKDFVEHLRTVHFALIAVAGALILIVISARPYKPNMALREVNEIIELRRLYKPDWIKGLGQQMYANFSPPNIPGFTPTDVESDVRSIPLTDLILTGTLHYTDGSKRRAETYAFRFPKKSVYYVAGPGTVVQDQFVQRLADFKIWWNLLPKRDYRQVKFIPLSFFAIGYVKDSSGKVIGYVRPDNLSTTSEPVDLQLNAEPKSFALYPNPSLTPMDIPFTYAGSREEHREIYFMVKSYLAMEVTLEGVVRYFPNWQPTPFDQCFADLDQAARQLDSLEFDEIQKIIAEDVGQRGEVFEAFGLKFPAEQITFWGIVIVLGVQLYFLLYLKQLDGKLESNDAGWDVPWIGMNQSRPGRSLFFSSVVLLPCAAVAFLGGRATIELLTHYFVRTAYFVRLGVRLKDIAFLDEAKVCLFFVSIPATMFLAYQSWKYRPRTSTEPSCPPQLFE